MTLVNHLLILDSSETSVSLFQHPCCYCQVSKLLQSLCVLSNNLIELHLIRKMLDSGNNNADQLSSQLVVSVHQVISVNIILVDYKHVIGLLIKMETFSSDKNVAPPFLCQYFSLFQKVFSNIRDYSQTTTLSKKSKFEEN